VLWGGGGGREAIVITIPPVVKLVLEFGSLDSKVILGVVYLMSFVTACSKSFRAQ
jgi:hypothetical protein